MIHEDWRPLTRLVLRTSSPVKERRGQACRWNFDGATSTLHGWSLFLHHLSVEAGRPQTRALRTRELETQSLNSAPSPLHCSEQRYAWWWFSGETPAGNTIYIERKKLSSLLTNFLFQSRLPKNVHQVSRHVEASPGAAVTGIYPPPSHIWPSLGHRFHIPPQTRQCSWHFPSYWLEALWSFSWSVCLYIILSVPQFVRPEWPGWLPVSLPPQHWFPHHDKRHGL